MFAAAGFHRVAEGYASRCRRALDDAPHDSDRAYALEVLGLYLLGAGRWDAAETCLQAGAELYGRLGLRRTEIECRQLHAGAVLRRGRYAESVALWQDVLARARAHHELFGEFWALVSLAKLGLRMHGRADDDCMVALHAAEALALDHLGVQEAVELCAVQARAHLALAQPEAAIEYTLKGLRCMQASRLTAAYALDGYTGIGECLLHLARSPDLSRSPWPEDARTLFRAAHDRIRAGSRAVPILCPYLYYLQGCHLDRDGRRDAAQARWRLGLGRAERLSMPYEAMLCHDALSRTTDGAVGREHGACVAELRASLAIRADTALDFVALGSRNAHESLSILQ